MATLQLQELPIEKVYANWFQPRKNFDKEKIKELSESILSNGLINPITVKKWRDGKYLIVSGERRWRAHKMGKIKNIIAVVKEYKSDGQFMVESLIENLHREDLNPAEASKFAKRIMKAEKIITVQELSKRLAIQQSTISQWFDADEIRKLLPTSIKEKVSPTVIYETKGLPEKERIELIKQSQKEDFGGSKMRQMVSEIKKDKELYADAEQPGVYERTARDVTEELNNWFTQGTHLINELIKDMNIEDLKQADKDSLVTSSGVMIFNTFPKLTNALIEAGAKADKKILELMEKTK